jgi:CBS domain-containing protein
VGLTVGNIPSALGGAESIPPSATLEQAITTMKLNGYSQLAVLAGTHTLRGAVTWQSIAYARHANSNATFSDAIVPAREARYDQELIEVLPDLETSDFIFVRDQTNAVKGIVTTADVVGTYRELPTRSSSSESLTKCSARSSRARSPCKMSPWRVAAPSGAYRRQRRQAIPGVNPLLVAPGVVVDFRHMSA